MEEQPHRTLAGVLARHDPKRQSLPLVFDSPHSGRHYPEDFQHALSPRQLRSTEDRFVDELFEPCPVYGASLLKALFPRSYIDPNRNPLDLDERLLDGPWPEEVRPGSKTLNGKGLIRSKALGEPIYDRKLTVAEVRARLEGYWQPYHRELETLLAARHRDFGAVWHINCHSWTPPETGRDGKPVRHLDICLGDRDGTTCDPRFTQFVADLLQDLGYVVRVNRPFKGMELIKRNGQPRQNRHSLQLEINRNLYLKKNDFSKNGGFDTLRNNLEQMVAAVADYVRGEL